jgi:hypothetical protein
MGFVLVPWDRLPAWMLHPMPLITIAETAVGIRLLGAYDDVAVNYYVRQGAGTARARGGLLGHRG